MTVKQITIALSAWQTMEQAVRDKVEEIKRLEAEAIGWRDNLRALWSALRMIRDCVEELGPAGAVPSEESILPEPHHEAEAIIKGIQAIAGRHGRAYQAGDVVMHEGPAEIASWFFPNEPEDDERRAALRKAIEGLLDKRIAEAAALR